MALLWLISGILAFSVFVFLYFVFKKHDLSPKQNVEAVEEYKETTEKLALRNVHKKTDKRFQREKDEDQSSLLGESISTIIMIVVIILVYSNVMIVLQESTIQDGSANAKFVSEIISFFPVLIFIVIGLKICSIIYRARFGDDF